MILSFDSMEVDKLSKNWKVNYLKKKKQKKTEKSDKELILKSISNNNAFIIYHYD